MAETKTARIGFVGCGGFATGSLFPNLHLADIDLIAVCDLDRGKAERNARNFGAREVYTDIEKMLDEQELDGVFVIGPAPMQYETAPAVLRRGIPVYVEKPSANVSEQAKELAELAEANGTWGQVGFMKHFAHVYRVAKDIASRPDFGPVRVVKCQFAQGPYPQLWGIDSPRRSMLIGQLCHIFDLVRFMGGDVAGVQAFYHEATEEQFAWSVNMRFVSGGIGHLDLNSLAHKQAFRDIVERLEIYGLEHHVVCEEMQRLKWTRPEDFVETAPAAGRYVCEFDPSWTSSRGNTLYGYPGEVAHFARRCVGEAEGGPDLWDSYEALRIGEAIYDSGEAGGTFVEIPARSTS